MLFRFILGCALLSSLIGNSFAAERCAGARVWHYTEQTQLRLTADKTPVCPDGNWGLAEFKQDPYSDAIRALHQNQSIERTTLVFHRPPLVTLKSEYELAAKDWLQTQRTAEFKFLNLFPTEFEAETLEPACNTGSITITFLTRNLPTEYEAANVRRLKNCARVQFVLGRYLKREDLVEAKRLQGIPLMIHNDYFPSKEHVAVLNQLESPLLLSIENALPSAEHIEALNQTVQLKALSLDLSHQPSSEQYLLLKNLSASKEGKLSVRWNLGSMSSQDLTALKSLTLARITVSSLIYSRAELTQELRHVSSELIVDEIGLLQ